MRRIVKRVLLGFGVVAALIAALVFYVWFTAFRPNRPIVDRATPQPGVTLVKDGFVSAALLDLAPDKVALIDCGNDKSASAIVAALSERHLAPGAVSAIFLTHGHGDHTGGCRAFPGAEVYAMEAELATIDGAVQVGHRLHDGDVVQLGSLRIEAFATPGHTPGSAVYLTRGALFFGDSAGGAKDGSMLPAVRLFSKDPAANVASLKALEAKLAPRAGEVRTLVFAHSGPLEGFAPFEAFARGH